MSHPSISANPYMEKALELANYAPVTGDVPVGAVVVCNDRIVGVGWNAREAGKRITAHAELIALEAAAQELGRWKLDGCDLYVTLEPCSMCASAIVQARIRSLYFAAWDPKAGAAGSVIDLFHQAWLNHQVTVYEGIMEEAGKALLQDFFRNLRQSPTD